MANAVDASCVTVYFHLIQSSQGTHIPDAE